MGKPGRTVTKWSDSTRRADEPVRKRDRILVIGNLEEKVDLNGWGEFN